MADCGRDSGSSETAEDISLLAVDGLAVMVQVLVDGGLGGFEDGEVKTW